MRGSLSDLAPKVRSYVEEKAQICQPDNLFICDGSEEENKRVMDILLEDKMVKPLPKYDNWWVVCSLGWFTTDITNHFLVSRGTICM